MLGLLESQALVIPATFRGFDYREMAAQIRGGLPRLERVFVARGEAPAGMEPFSALTDTAWEAKAGPPDLCRAATRHRPRSGVHVGHDGRAQGRHAHAQHDAVDHLHR